MKEILKRWNPWWANNVVPETRKGLLRNKELNKINGLAKSKEAILISGVRRSGKSTLMHQAIDSLIEKKINSKNILYFNFDEPLQDKTIEILYQTFLEVNNPKGRKYLFFDEIQNVPEWEKWIKKYYDLYGNEIKFFLSGSNSAMLSSNLGKLLTGRVISITIYPLSFDEFLRFNKVIVTYSDLQKEEIKHYLNRYLQKGGFPEAVLEKKKDVNEQRLRGYYDSILLRDVVYSGNLRETAKLKELGSFLMTNIAKPLSYNNISKAIGLNINTLKEYLNLLENAFLIFQLRYFSYSLKESIMEQKQRKIFVVDNGLREIVSFKFSKDQGKLAENIVFIELKRRDKEIYYWKEKKEVDFVVKGQRLDAINVCFDNKINEREITGLEEFKKKFGNKVGRLIIITQDLEKKEDNIEFMPLWKWLLSPDMFRRI